MVRIFQELEIKGKEVKRIFFWDRNVTKIVYRNVFLVYSEFKSVFEVFNEDIDKIVYIYNNEDNVDYLLDKIITYKDQLAKLTKQIKGLKIVNVMIFRHLGFS